MTRRTAIKWMHWGSLALIIYFFAVEPEDVERLGNAALATHAGVGLIFGLVVLIWFALYLKNGLTGRAGPKLPYWGKRFHPFSHRALYWGLFVMAVSGGLIGLFAPYVVLAFGFLPIAPSLDVAALHNISQEVHEIIFDALMIGIILHAGFHIWRHIRLKDNALRIMVPKMLHRYL